MRGRLGSACRACMPLVLGALITACSEEDGPEPQQAPGPSPAALSGNSAGRSFERNFVFTTTSGDSTFVVPWMLETTTRPGTVIREASGWLARSGTWEGFFSERWETPPTRSPARVLPHGSLRFVVREGDVVDGIIYDEGPRNLEIGLGNVLTSWAGPRGEVFQLLEGSLYIAEQRIGGLVLDMARGSSAETPPSGDWALLTSGDSLQIVLQGTSEHDPAMAPAYLGWARLDFRDLQWSDLSVDWGETSAFHPARRDVPVAWTITSVAGDLEGSLTVTSADIRQGEGEGPMLPLRALYEVEGDFVIEERSFPVRGLFAHERR